MVAVVGHEQRREEAGKEHTTQPRMGCGVCLLSLQAQQTRAKDDGGAQRRRDRSGPTHLISHFE